MPIGNRNGFAYAERLFQVPRPVLMEQDQIALQARISRVDVTEHLHPRRVNQALLPPNIELGSGLLSLVAIENAHRDRDAHTEKSLDWWVAGHVQGESCVGRAV